MRKGCTRSNGLLKIVEFMLLMQHTSKVAISMLFMLLCNNGMQDWGIHLLMQDWGTHQNHIFINKLNKVAISCKQCDIVKSHKLPLVSSHANLLSHLICRT